MKLAGNKIPLQGSRKYNIIFKERMKNWTNSALRLLWFSRKVAVGRVRFK